MIYMFGFDSKNLILAKQKQKWSSDNLWRHKLFSYFVCS